MKKKGHAKKGSGKKVIEVVLELLNGSLIDTSALVDQVTGGGGLTGIDVTDDNDVNVLLLDKMSKGTREPRRKNRRKAKI